MDKIKKPKTPSEAEVMSELGCVPMSDEALKKMSLNPYDQLFICRLMTMRDDAAKDEMYDAVAEVMVAQNKRMFEVLDEQTKMMKAMISDIADIKTRLSADELAIKLIGERLELKKKRLDVVENDIVTINKRVGIVERIVKKLNNK